MKFLFPYLHCIRVSCLLIWILYALYTYVPIFGWYFLKIEVLLDWSLCFFLNLLVWFTITSYFLHLEEYVR